MPLFVPAGKPREVLTAFDFTQVGAVDFGALAPGESVIGVQVVIDQVFDDPSTLISLGLVSNPDSILSTADVDPTTASTYAQQANILIAVADAFRLKVFPFASTQGAGRVVALVG